MMTLAFVLGEAIAIQKQAALLGIAMLLVLLKFAIRGKGKKKSKIQKSKIGVVDFIVAEKDRLKTEELPSNIGMGDFIGFWILVLSFLIAGFYFTTTEIKCRDRIWQLEEKPVVITGTVSQITETEYGVQYIVAVKEFAGTKKVNILVESDERYNLAIGNQIQVTGKIEQFVTAKNQGNFDMRNYYMSLGIYTKIKGYQIQRTGSQSNIVKENLRQFRQRCIQKIDQICNDENEGGFRICNRTQAGTLQGILLGTKQNLNRDIKSLYQMNGISHILAISGLHISFLGMLMYSLLRKRVKFVPAAMVSMGVVLLFAIMTGFGVATVRATVMFGMNLLGEVCGRKNDTITSISIAFLFLVISNPFVIFHSGFQMSFIAIIGASIVWKELSEFIGIETKIANAFGFSLCISIMIQPVIAWNYYQLPMYAVFLNMIVVSLMSIVLLSGIVGLAGSFVHVWIGKICMLPACAILKLYTQLCKILEHIPGYSVVCGKPSLGIVIAYYLVIFLGMVEIRHLRAIQKQKKEQRGNQRETQRGNQREIPLYGEVIGKKERKKEIQREIPLCGEIIISEKERKKEERILRLKKCAVLTMVIALLTGSLFICPMSGLQVSMLDVGQGDGIFIRTKNVTMMIDCGSSDKKEIGKYQVIPCLKSMRVRVLDYVIVSHFDEDHISGVKELMEQSQNGGIRVKHLVLPRLDVIDEAGMELEQTAQQKNIKVLYIAKGDYLRFGNLTITCLHPDAQFHTDDRNDSSAVLDLCYGKFKMLLTGDVSSEAEAYFMEKSDGKNSKMNEGYTVLKVAHHGSRFSTSEKFLQIIQPRYAIISCGKKNSYGHPHLETIKRLQAIGCQILRTDECGEITFRVKQNGATIETYVK